MKIYKGWAGDCLPSSKKKAGVVLPPPQGLMPVFSVKLHFNQKNNHLNKLEYFLFPLFKPKNKLADNGIIFYFFKIDILKAVFPRKIRTGADKVQFFFFLFIVEMLYIV